MPLLKFRLGFASAILLVEVILLRSTLLFDYAVCKFAIGSGYIRAAEKCLIIIKKTYTAPQLITGSRDQLRIESRGPWT